MRSRNSIILGAAVLFGLVAVFLANTFFSGVEERQERVAEEQQLVRIVVATQDMGFGAQLDQTKLRLANWPADAVPNGAFNSIEDAIRGGRVSLRPIVVGEPVLASKVSGEGGRATLSAILPEEQRAVTIPIDAISGVGGFVRAGDVVDVMLTRQIPGDGATAQDKFTTVVLENVLVLAVDQVANEDDTDPAIGSTATVQTNMYDAQKLTLATKLGDLSLALRNVENQLVGSTIPVLPNDLGRAGVFIPARTNNAAVPAAGPPRSPRSSARDVPAEAVPRRPSGPTMKVIRGTESQTYEVGYHGA